MNNLEIMVKHTDELSPEELVEIMIERVKVFVLEQNCPYQEIDEEDYEAEHVIVKKDNRILAYARLLEDHQYLKIGRVLVVNTFRKRKLGHKLVRTAIEELRRIDAQKPIKISAQAHLQKFYGAFGFKPVSEIYLEDDIPHIDMLLEAK